MRDLLAPKWLLLFLIVAVLSAVFISLGMWQLERWDESKVEAAQVAERLGVARVAVDARLQVGLRRDARGGAGGQSDEEDQG